MVCYVIYRLFIVLSCSGKEMEEDFRSFLRKEEDRQRQSLEKLSKCNKILDQAKAGVEHLAHKLEHIKVTNTVLYNHLL